MGFQKKHVSGRSEDLDFFSSAIFSRTTHLTDSNFAEIYSLVTKLDLSDNMIEQSVDRIAFRNFLNLEEILLWDEIDSNILT